MRLSTYNPDILELERRAFGDFKFIFEAPFAVGRSEAGGKPISMTTLCYFSSEPIDLHIFHYLLHLSYSERHLIEEAFKSQQKYWEKICEVREEHKTYIRVTQPVLHSYWGTVDNRWETREFKEKFIRGIDYVSMWTYKMEELYRTLENFADSLKYPIIFEGGGRKPLCIAIEGNYGDGKDYTIGNLFMPLCSKKLGVSWKIPTSTPIFPVSTDTGLGVEDLKNRLFGICDTGGIKEEEGILPRLLRKGGGILILGEIKGMYSPHQLLINPLLDTGYFFRKHGINHSLDKRGATLIRSLYEIPNGGQLPNHSGPQYIDKPLVIAISSYTSFNVLINNNLIDPSFLDRFYIIRIPSLKEREDDIYPIFNFLLWHNKSNSLRKIHIDKECFGVLAKIPNIRGLVKVVDGLKALLMSKTGEYHLSFSVIKPYLPQEIVARKEIVPNKNILSEWTDSGEIEQKVEVAKKIVNMEKWWFEVSKDPTLAILALKIWVDKYGWPDEKKCPDTIGITRTALNKFLKRRWNISRPAKELSEMSLSALSSLVNTSNKRGAY